MALHALALHLGMTRGELEERMTWQEFMDWNVYFSTQRAAEDGNLAHGSPQDILKGFGL